MADKGIYKTWFVPIAVGISIIIGAGIIIGFVGMFISQMSYESKQMHMDDEVKELKKSFEKIITQTTKGNSNILILTNEIKHLAMTVKELKAEVRGSYTSKLEYKRANISSESKNEKIAFNVDF